MKLWEKMLEDEHRHFNYMRERIDEEEAMSVNAMKRFLETGLCEDTDYSVKCARCPFRTECNESQIKNATRLGSEYLKEKLMQEVEI